MRKLVGFLVIGLAMAGLASKWSSSHAEAIEQAEASTAEEKKNVAGERQPASEKAAEKPNAKAPAGGAKVAATPSRVHDLAQRLREINACYQKSCDYPDTYPHDYENGVGQALKKTLRQLRDAVREEQLVSPEIAGLAREFLENSDGHVKEAALDLIATQPISPENRDAILRDVIGDYDSNLISHALLELRRYQGAEDQGKIQQSLVASLATGAPYVAIAIAENITPFLSDSSVPKYSQVAKSMDRGSVVRTNLEASIAEFQRHKSGG